MFPQDSVKDEPPRSPTSPASSEAARQRYFPGMIGDQRRLSMADTQGSSRGKVTALWKVSDPETTKKWSAFARALNALCCMPAGPHDMCTQCQLLVAPRSVRHPDLQRSVWVPALASMPDTEVFRV